MFMCKHPGGNTASIGGTPYILTGAVTGRQGFQDSTYQIEYQQNGQNHVMKVPTHMWTTMICLNNAGTQVNHMSFIGSNYQEGKVVFYPNFQHFTSDLQDMYGEAGNMFSFQPVDGAYNLPLGNCNTDLVCTLPNNAGPIFPTWSGLPVPKLRANILINNLLESMKVTGHDASSVFGLLQEQSDLKISVIAVNLMRYLALDEHRAYETFAEIILLSGAQVQGIEFFLPNHRNKRDVSTETETPSNNSYLLLKVNDSDPARDLKLSQCTLTEVDSNTTMAIDKHTIDIESMRPFEEKENGPTVTVKKMIPNETEIVIPNFVLKETIINIVLRPGRTPKETKVTG